MSCVMTSGKAIHWSGLWVASAYVTCVHKRKGGPHRAATSKRAMVVPNTRCTCESPACVFDATSVGGDCGSEPISDVFFNGRVTY